MADVAADVDGEVTTDGAGGRGQRVGGAEEDCKRKILASDNETRAEGYGFIWIRTTAGLDGVTALPDHGADGARQHV